jgi:ABC-type dipeptide/oligopeptide/nickel transport system ATPase component
MADAPALSVKGLVTHFYVAGGVVKAVDGVDLEVGRDEIVAIVGESGSGKSVTALSIMRLIAEPGRIVAGEVMHQGSDLLKLSQRQMQQVRGNSISMVFQNPHGSLHPMLRIGHQMVEAIRLRTTVTKADARRQAAAMLEHIGVEDATGVLERYPFEVSAGVSQRVMLAIALISRPALLIADEPTTNLDALAQIQFLRLVKQMRDELRMSVLLITHDFGVVSMLADRVVVMYAGKQMEAGDAGAVDFLGGDDQTAAGAIDFHVDRRAGKRGG